MSRKLAREAAFKALFQLDFNFEEDKRETCENLAIETMFDEEPKLTLKKDFAYIESTVKGTREHLAEIDEIITANLKEGWQLPMRLAVYEMKFVEPKLSKNIAINEAVELAKKYGTDDSSRFVNGILETISK